MPAVTLRAFSAADPDGLPLGVGEIEAEAGSRRWSDPRNALGTGSFLIHLDDPDVVHLAYGNLVRGYIDGVPCFSWIIDDHDEVAIDADSDDGDAVRMLKVSGNGALRLLQDGEVYPEGGPATITASNRYKVADQRLFGYGSIHLDDTPWGLPVLVNAIHPFPEGWEDYGANWFWSTDVIPAPIGDAYFRRKLLVTIDGETQSDRFSLQITADDGFEVIIGDRVVLNELTPYMWGTKREVDVEIEPDIIHQVAIRGTNIDAGGTGVAGVMFSLIPYQDGGSRLRDEPDGPGLRGIMRSNLNEWKCLGYPPGPPGLTPGHIMNIFLDEWQARGGPVVARGFTATLDSDGVPWPAPVEQSFAVGDDYVDVLTQMAEDGLCDFEWAADVQRLDLFVSQGQDRTATVDFGEDTLSDLSHQGTVREQVNTLLVRYRSGWVERVDPAKPVGAQRKERFLSLGDASLEEVDRRCARYFLEHRDPQVQTTCVVEPATGLVAYRDYGKGDLVTAGKEGGGSGPAAVVAISVSEDDAGELISVPELDVMLLPPPQRLANAVRSFAAGTGSGTVSRAAPPIASPAFSPYDSPVVIPRPSDRLTDWTYDRTDPFDGAIPVWSDEVGAWEPGAGGSGDGGREAVFSQGGAMVVGSSGPYPVRTNRRMIEVVFSADQPGSTSSTAVINVDGVALVTLVLGSNSTGVVQAVDVALSVGQRLTGEITVAGEGALRPTLLVLFGPP